VMVLWTRVFCMRTNVCEGMRFGARIGILQLGVLSSL
jgi:hypothetical protein